MIFMPFLLGLGVVYYWVISFFSIDVLFAWLICFAHVTVYFVRTAALSMWTCRGQSFMLAWCFVNFRVATIKHPHQNATGLRNPHSSPTPNFQFLESLIKSCKGLISILDFRVTKIHPQIPQQIFINIYPAVSNTNNYFPQQFLSNSFRFIQFFCGKKSKWFPLFNFPSFFRKDLRQKERLPYNWLTFIFMFHLFFIHVPSIFPWFDLYIAIFHSC